MHLNLLRHQFLLHQFWPLVKITPHLAAGENMTPRCMRNACNTEHVKLPQPLPQHEPDLFRNAINQLLADMPPRHLLPPRLHIGSTLTGLGDMLLLAYDRGFLLMDVAVARATQQAFDQLVDSVLKREV
jgi:hypothetical protein